MTELKGRTALVTGAGGGLGSAIARALAAAGVHLALSDRPGVDLTALLAEVTAHGVHAESVPADLMDRDQRLALVPDAEKAIGPLDILVNNAGVEYMTRRSPSGPPRTSRSPPRSTCSLSCS